MKKLLPLFAILCMAYACTTTTEQPTNTTTISLSTAAKGVDSIYIMELLTEKIIAKLPITEEEVQFSITLDSTTAAAIEIPYESSKKSHLAILSPQKSNTIHVQADSNIVSNELADSLLNQMWRNQNAFISENSPFIFSTEKYDSIVVLFDTFRQERKTQILNHIDALSPDEIELLLFQNEARINSFLFFFGRINKDLAPEHEFFSFKHQIDNNIKWAKTLPNNILYKHELDYLLTYDSLTSIHDFLAYVQSQTTNEDLFDYMKVIYIRAIIENPSYWARHQKIFNTEDIEAILEQEKDSKYFSLLKQPTKDYFSTRQGVEAYNFTAERMDGSTLQLSNLEGKLVYIDNWATWCGPCVAQRPLVLEMAKRYKNDPRIEVLMVALNRERKDWVNYLTKNNQLGIKADLFIENGLYSEYANAYNIKSIPKYILISPDGLIINAHVGKPSQELYDLIDQELEKIQLTETSKAISKSSEQSLK